MPTAPLRSLRLAKAASRTYKRALTFVRRSFRSAEWSGPRLNRPWHAGRYMEIMKQPLRLDPPVGFNDHVVHRILYDRDPLLKQLCDKLAVRDIIRERVGAEFVVPLLGVWAKSRNIDWQSLPERFVLKPSHGSGHTALVTGAGVRDPVELAGRAEAWLRHDYFDHSREWGYSGIPRRILAEPMLAGPDGDLPIEAQVMTFGGRTGIIRVLTGAKGTPGRRDNWFDARGIPQSFHSLQIAPGDYRLDAGMARELVEVAERVSDGLSHLRVDFYLTADGLRIGELTPYHGAGLNRWSEPGCDWLFGRFWQSPATIDEIADLGATIRDASRFDPAPWIQRHERIIA